MDKAFPGYEAETQAFLNLFSEGFNLAREESFAIIQDPDKGECLVSLLNRWLSRHLNTPYHLDIDKLGKFHATFDFIL